MSTQQDVATLAALNKQAQFMETTGIAATHKAGEARSELEKYPAQYYTKHPEEERRAILEKAQTAGFVDRVDAATGRVEPGLYSRPQLDAVALDFIRSKQESEELLAFERWIAQTFNMSDPNVCRYVKQMYPRYFERKMEQIDRDTDLLKRVAKMRVKGGPDTMEDLVVQFQIDSGALDLGPVEQMLAQYRDQSDDENNRLVNRGLFNPYKYVGRKAPRTIRQTGQDQWWRKGTEGAAEQQAAFTGFGGAAAATAPNGPTPPWLARAVA